MMSTYGATQPCAACQKRRRRLVLRTILKHDQTSHLVSARTSDSVIYSDIAHYKSTYYYYYYMQIAQGSSQELMEGVFLHSFPSSLPSPSLSCPSPPLSYVFPSLALPCPSVRSRASLSQLEGLLLWGSAVACKLPQRGPGQSPA